MTTPDFAPQGLATGFVTADALPERPDILALYREGIDEIDEHIVSLLVARQGLALAADAIKEERGQSVLAPLRETQVLDHVREVNARLGGRLSNISLITTFTHIMRDTREAQQEARNRRQAEREIGSTYPGSSL